MNLDFIAERKRMLGLTNSTFASLSGINLSTLEKITSGVNQNPTLDTLERIAEALECSLDDLSDKPRRSMGAVMAAVKYDALDEYGQEAVNAILDAELRRVESQQPAHKAPSSSVQRADNVRLRHYESPAAAGQPINAESDYAFVSYPARAVPSGTDFALTISGRSMEPLIPDGSTVFVRRSRWASDGDIVVAWVDGEGAVCKRARMKGRQLLKLESVNKEFPDIEGMALNGLRLFGKALGVLNKDGTSAVLPASPTPHTQSGEDGVLAFMNAQDRSRSGEVIHSARLSLGITHHQLARAIGVSPQDVLAWEDGRKAVPEDKTKPLSRLLNIPMIVLKE